VAQKTFKISKVKEKEFIQLGIILFWFVYWLFNVIDKFIAGTAYLWVGKDRFAQFVDYFRSIGITDPSVASNFLIITTVLEITALVFVVVTLWYFLQNNGNKQRAAFFYATLMSLFIFTFFSAGDQVFGDRVELLEHSIYWIITLISWFVYTKIDIASR
jgi:hypothetical protein